MEELIRDFKKKGGRKPPTEIGVVTRLKPFAFTIGGQEYSSEDWTIYLPAVDRIKQYKDIEVETQDNNQADAPTTNKGKATVEIGDLELEPDFYSRRFLIGDLIDVTDRGDSFVVHGRLVKADDATELYTPTHRG